MKATFLIILFLITYFLTTYFIVYKVKKRTTKINPYLRFLILSLCYSLFWGLGIAGSDGHPGFAFPAPNIVAIILMADINYYTGVITGFYILFFWWASIFLIMFLNYFFRNKRIGIPK